MPLPVAYDASALGHCCVLETNSPNRASPRQTTCAPGCAALLLLSATTLRRLSGLARLTADAL